MDPSWGWFTTKHGVFQGYRVTTASATSTVSCAEASSWLGDWKRHLVWKCAKAATVFQTETGFREVVFFFDQKNQSYQKWRNPICIPYLRLFWGWGNSLTLSRIHTASLYRWGFLYLGTWNVWWFYTQKRQGQGSRKGCRNFFVNIQFIYKKRLAKHLSYISFTLEVVFLEMKCFMFVFLIL